MTKRVVEERWGESVAKLSKDFYVKAGRAIVRSVRQLPKLNQDLGKRIER